jgi:hypothetical protein
MKKRKVEEEEEEEKKKVYDFKDLPFIIILDILQNYYCFNYTKQFVKTALREKFYNFCRDFRSLVEIFFIRTLYGYFKRDYYIMKNGSRSKKRIRLLYKSFKLKDYVVSCDGHPLDIYKCPTKNEFIPSFWVKKEDFLNIMLIGKNTFIIEGYHNTNFVDIFMNTNSWIIPNKVERLIYKFVINDHQTSHIPLNLKYLNLEFISQGLNYGIETLDYNIIKRCLEKNIYPTIVFDNFIFGTWTMYYFIKYFNDLANDKWKIYLIDCYFEDYDDEEIKRLLLMDGYPGNIYKKKKEIIEIIKKWEPSAENLVFKKGFKVKLKNCVK